VWLDDDLVVDEALQARVTKKILSFRLRRGSVDELLEISPGRHELRVRVSWDDNVRTKWVSGTFRAGATRVLEIRVLRILNELELELR